MTTQGIEPVEVGVLTDEELAVVAGTEGAAVFPVLSAMTEADRTIAVRTAYRSLVARGLVEPVEGAGPVDVVRTSGGDLAVDVDVRVPESLAGVLEMRRSTELVVAVGRTTAAGEEYCYAYVNGDAVLLEVVSGGGVHRFVVRAAADVPEVVQRWSLNEAAVDGHGEGAHVPPLQPGDEARPPQPVLDALGAAYLRADVFVFRPGDEQPPLMGVFSGPRGTWRATARFGVGTPVLVEPVTVDQVRRELADLLAS